MHFSFASKSLPTFIALTVSTMLRGIRGGVKINGCSLTLSDSIFKYFDLILSHLNE